MSNFEYFKAPILVSLIGLAISFVIGWRGENDFSQAFSTVFICAILGILEISLSFDNAVVNAKYLERVTPIWRHRFLTWGIVIAVLGVRLILPLLIVGVIAHIDPLTAVVMAATEPARYGDIVQLAHVPVAGFGGAFLLMVALRFFFDPDKDHHWIRLIEKRMAQIGRIRFIEIVFVAVIIYIVSRLLHEPSDKIRLMVSAAAGLATFLSVDFLSLFLESTAAKRAAHDIHRASIGVFIYLEVLDASFSFDGVVGAFAISNNLFVITIGLGIGAMFVRSLTLLFVERGTLTEYAYLENGAFYAIAVLGLIMLANTIVDIPEVITGLVGAILIALAFRSSMKQNRRELRAKKQLH